ncbi:MAG: Tab2/Atab2 family RNA-binding protein [Leptolyngbyaceae cyanobacterium bins.302]|nr:Tab2/Atab2 family RNA-binding protein [Leptolyngbyaceae cyanobacterium bins.302]
MTTWEIDFYRRPLQDEAGNPLWEWVVCDSDGTLKARTFCPQPAATAEWVLQQLQQILSQEEKLKPGDRPALEKIQVFRPQTLNLLEAPCKHLGISLEATRHTPNLKQLLQELAPGYSQMTGYIGQSRDLFALDQPPPVPLDEQLQGHRWQFASLPAGEIVDFFAGRMMPILEIPEPFLPLKLGLPSTLPIPGVIIEGGRRSLRLAQWIQENRPAALRYIPGAPDGLILEASLVDRWILATFDDPDVMTAAQNFEHRKQASQGLHFLLIQPDNSGMTYSGFWLLLHQ